MKGTGPEAPSIPGAESVISWFGYWPGFHDCEIIDLRLGSDSVLRLRAFEMTDKIDAAGYYKLHKHCTVSFWFSDEVAFSLVSESGTSGIVFSLDFLKDGNHPKMEIQSSCGVDGWILAKNWRVELERSAGTQADRIE